MFKMSFFFFGHTLYISKQDKTMLIIIIKIKYKLDSFIEPFNFDH